MKKLIAVVAVVVVALLLIGIFKVGIRSTCYVSIKEGLQGNGINIKLSDGEKWDVICNNSETVTSDLEYIKSLYGVSVANECKQLARNRTYSFMGLAGWNVYGGNSIVFSVRDLDTENFIPARIIIDGNTYYSSSNGLTIIHNVPDGNHTVVVEANGYKSTEMVNLYYSGVTPEIWIYMVNGTSPSPPPPSPGPSPSPPLPSEQNYTWLLPVIIGFGGAIPSIYYYKKK